MTHLRARPPLPQTQAGPFRAGREASTSGATAAGGLQHRVYGSFEQAQALRSDWDELAARTGDLFASYDWGDVWWRYYGGNRRLQIHVMHDGPHLVAIVPLFHETVRPLGVPLRVVRLVGCDHTVSAAGLAIDPGYVRAVVRLLVDALECQGHWDLIHLGPLQPYMQITDAMARAFANESVVDEVIEGAHDNCVTVFDIPDTYEHYLASLPGSERRNILRCERNAAADYQIQADVPTCPEDVRRAMDILVRLHQNLWTGKGKLGQFRDWPDYERFHAEMAERHLAAGRLALVTLRADDEILGVEYGYHFGSRTHALIRGYRDDAKWRTYSIGRMLHCHMVRQAIARGSHLMDDGRGAFEYKRRLGGRLGCERSLTVVRRGKSARLRMWLALRAAWCVHATYNRVWFDWLRPKLPLPAAPLRRSYIRMRFLALLCKRAPLALRVGEHLCKASCSQAEPACPLATSARAEAMAAACK